MIELNAVTKRYGAFVALDDVTFRAEPGRVTGFLGPNGAGKTTAMRVLAGLTVADAGDATVGGQRLTQMGNPGTEVGILLDASAQHAGRTGREVLTLAAMTMGLPRARVDEMLALVGLDGREGKRKVRNYSLGMRQRLGIAHALLGDPSTLILDEPANGLDPAGIRWMRGLLADFASRGGTVLLSSHLLHEVEVVADELVLIGRGKIVAQGTTAELLANASAGAPAVSLVSAQDQDTFARLLQSAGYEVVPAGSGLSVKAETHQVGRVAADNGIVLTDLRAGQTQGLEDIFLSLTAADAREQVANTSGAVA